MTYKLDCRTGTYSCPAVLLYAAAFDGYEEISFIHDANTEAQKAGLFAKVRRGQVRVLIGSTQKMGAGTNVQDRIVASHDLDCPWRPADLEQRAGRSLRQGNMNQKVKMFKYVTKGTFDAYNWVRHEAV